MDNFNNPNDPYGVGNQNNPYESVPQDDPYTSVPQNSLSDYMPQNDSFGQETSSFSPETDSFSQETQSSVSSLDSVYIPQNDQYNPNQSSSTFNGYDQTYSSNNDFNQNSFNQNNTYMNQNPNPYTAPPANNAYIPAPQINPQGMNSYVPYNGNPQPPMYYGDSEQDKKNANILCLISAICYFLPWVISFLYTLIKMGSMDLDSYSYDYDTTSSSVAYFLSGLNFIAYIAAWVLMIVARVKYKNSTFAKVLMWVYIGFFILGIILIVVVILTCAAAFNSMLSECPDVLFHTGF